MTTTASAPLAGESLNMEHLLAHPPEPVAWAVDHVAARGYLTTLVGPPGVGKSWLALLFAAGVQAGDEVGGLACSPGRSLCVDAENGQGVAVRRFREAGLDGDAMTYHLADGVDLARERDRDALESMIHETGATFVVLDALKRLTPSARENENDAMAPIIGGLGQVARASDAAIILLHHRSVKDGSQGFRGASAVQDQSDLMLGLSGSVGDLRVKAAKFRLCEEPPERHMALRPLDRRLAFVESGARLSPREQLVERVREHEETILADGGWPRRQIASAVGCDAESTTLERALGVLLDEHGWSRTGSTRRSVYVPPST